MDRDRAHTYVLVHGAFHGGWCWADVAEGLRRKGHRVFTPTLTGMGERSHLIGFRPNLETWIEDVAQVLRFEDLSDVILVGHSFSGSIVSAIADRMPDRLRRIIYLDAMVLESGQSPKDVVPAGRIEAYELRARESGGIVVAPNDPEAFGIVEPAMKEWFRSKLTPHPIQTYLDPLELDNPLGNGVVATYIACSRPFAPYLTVSRSIAHSMPGWTYLEIPTDHNVMTLDPKLLVDLLVCVDTAESMQPTEPIGRTIP